MAKKNKPPSKKVIHESIWKGDGWKVVKGRLKPSPGRPSQASRLFEFVAEKLPYGSLGDVKKWMTANATHLEGVYLAHDSMGTARYGGRGQIFSRLWTHRNKYPRELIYFSFYVVKEKKHEREIETVILRAAGPQMTLNQRKVRNGIDRGNVSDYEPQTEFFERQRLQGKKKKTKERKTWSRWRRSKRP